MKAWTLRQPFWSFYILAVLLSIFANAWMFGFEPNIGQVLNDAQDAFGLNHFSVLVPLSLMLSHPLLLPSFLFPSAPADFWKNWDGGVTPCLCCKTPCVHHCTRHFFSAHFGRSGTSHVMYQN